MRLQESEGATLNEEETSFWRGFLRETGAITAAVEKELTAATGLSAADFQILARLSEAEQQRVSQKTMSTLLGWSATRLSHQLSRMGDRALIERFSGGHGRTMVISITEVGEAAYHDSLPVQAAAVREHFFRRLTISEGLSAREFFVALAGPATV